ncbi:hypothetical protein KY321_04585 [Candidatus Woesearchaeota archaeon]|nr:hypothetical protein [Candidatus Woesearchaeota archaeon]
MEYTPFRLAYHLLLTTGTKFGLPEKELSKESNDYVLKGRYGGKHIGMSSDQFVRGNAIDIMTQFIDKKDFVSSSGAYHITYNLYAGRILFPAKDLEIDSKIKGEAFFNDWWHDRTFLKDRLEFIYEDGILKPEPFITKPDEIKEVQGLMSLKCPVEFSEEEGGYVPIPQTVEPTLISENSFAQYKQKDKLLEILIEAYEICKKGIPEDDELHELRGGYLEFLIKDGITPEKAIKHLF